MAHLESNRTRSPFDTERPFLSGVRLPNGERWLVVALALITLLIWEWMVERHLLSSLFFPAPSQIMKTFVQLVSEGTLVTETVTTLRRVVLGLVIGGLPGLLLGMTMGHSRTVRRLFSPLVAAAHPVPKIAILPLIMIIAGIGEAPIVIVAATGAFFPLLINSLSGVEQIDRLYFQVAQNYGADTKSMLGRVMLPGSLPFILSGLLLALNVTLLLTIAVEMVSGRTGLGGMMWFAWETMRVEDLYVALVVVMLLGMAMNAALQMLSKRLVPWHFEADLQD